jgi:hypothetical protein
MITERRLLIDDYIAIAGWVHFTSPKFLMQILLVGTYIPLIIALPLFQLAETGDPAARVGS